MVESLECTSWGELPPFAHLRDGEELAILTFTRSSQIVSKPDFPSCTTVGDFQPCLDIFTDHESESIVPIGNKRPPRRRFDTRDYTVRSWPTETP